MHSKVISTETLGSGTDEENSQIGGLLPVYKNYGETPLECLNRIRAKFPSLENTTLSYAGRLDPLAEGIMLVLVGKQFNQDRKTYLQLEKEYEVEVLFGLSTDTGDILGIPKQVDLRKLNLEISSLRQTIEGLKGRQHFLYPVFSSRTVKGKPLFAWAKENRLNEIVIPKTEIYIKEISLTGTGMVTAPAFVEHLKRSIALISGDFRQNEILAAWDEIFLNNISINDTCMTCTLKVRCSSGSYMRTLSEEIGKRLGLPALAYSIRRTKIGDVEVSEANIIH